MIALRHRLYRRLHPRAYRAGQLAEQRHQLYDPPVPVDCPAAVDGVLDPVVTPVDTRPAPCAWPGCEGRGRGAS